MNQEKWDRLVAEGQQLATALSVDKFGLGDKALEVAPMGDNQAHTGGLAKLEQYAEAIGVKAASLREYRRVAFAWPHHDRNLSSASFSVHQDLAAEPNRVAILRRLTRRAEKAGLKRVPQNWVREEIGKAPTGQAIRTETQDTPPSVEQIQRTIQSNPEIAERVVADDATRVAINRAKTRVDDASEKAVDDRLREAAPGLMETGDFTRASSKLLHARRDLLDSLDSLKKIERLSSGMKDEVREYTAWIVTAAGWVDSFLQGDRSFEDELSELLKGA